VDSNLLTIQELLDEKDSGLCLSLLAGANGLSNQLSSPRIQKPGLALSGYTEHFHPDRIQVLGNTEVSYLNSLSESDGIEILKRLCCFPITCFVVTTDLTPPAFFTSAVADAGIPVLKTCHTTSDFISMITTFLEERALPTTHTHGVLVDVLGVGVLLTGKSGVGKSECALDLVIRGHRLVADDVVFIKKKLPSSLIGQAAQTIQHLMEIRGLGIINIKDLYGVSSIREKKIIDIMLELKDYSTESDCDRLGLDDHTISILGVDIPHIVLPVRPGRNMGTIVEVAARNYLLKGMGYHSALDFHQKLLARMDNRTSGIQAE